MKSRFLVCLCTLIALGLIGCTKSDQKRARQNAAEAQQKSRDEAHKLEREAKQGVRDFNAQVNTALKQHPTDANSALNQAGEKLDSAAHIARQKSEQAAIKLTRAAYIAKVKAKLANDVGLSSASNIEVGADDGTVTLSGTVSSEDRRQQAEQSASQVDGVTKVINHLTVQR